MKLFVYTILLLGFLVQYTFGAPIIFPALLTENIQNVIQFLTPTANNQELDEDRDLVQHIKQGTESRKLTGRFLHITDLHPDPYYAKGTDPDTACHYGKHFSETGKYGAPRTECDSPLALIDATFKWIEENLKGEIDFIVWTGDNAKHDSDSSLPRNWNEVLKLNEYIASKFVKVFGTKSDDGSTVMTIPVVPSIGNNDVYPHNVVKSNPTEITKGLYNAWRKFIPQEQYHIFKNGGYYIKEIIPNKLAVISLNTMYWFKRNTEIENCDSKFDPGRKHFKWLGVVLKELRKRNMKVYLSGHVPPVSKNYDETCLRKYALWAYEYQDIIIGAHYGHMNIDHFIPLDAAWAYDSVRRDYGVDALPFDIKTDLSSALEFEQNLDIATENVMQMDFKEDFEIKNGKGKLKYLNTLRDICFTKIKKSVVAGWSFKNKNREFDDSSRYVISHVSPPLVPNYFPTLRVWDYNITDISNPTVDQYQLQEDKYKSWGEISEQFEKDYELEMLFDKYMIKNNKNYKRIDESFPPKRKHGHKSSGPGYTPQLFTPIKYNQFFANLTAISNKEYEFKFDSEYKTDEFPYNLNSMIADEWISLAKQMAPQVDEVDEEQFVKSNKLWEIFVSRAFVSTDLEFRNI